MVNLHITMQNLYANGIVLVYRKISGRLWLRPTEA